MIALAYIPTVYWGTFPPTSSPTFVIVYFWMSVILTWVSWNITMVFLCFLLMVNNPEHGLVGHFYYILWKSLVHIFSPFCNWIVVVVVVEFLFCCCCLVSWALSRSWALILYHMHNLQTILWLRKNYKISPFQNNYKNKI